MEIIIGFIGTVFRSLFLLVLFVLKRLWRIALETALKAKNWYHSMKSMWLRGKISQISRKKKIFIYGYPQAGKTTFMASLVKYLRDNDGTTLRPNPVNNPEGAKLIEKWLEALDSGSFPEKATDDNYWERVEIEYRKSDEEKNRAYVFQEIAGETAIRFDPTHDKHHQIDQTAQDFLIDSNGVLIIAAATPDVTEEKYRLSYFLELLYRLSYDRPILFLLTKFDKVSTTDTPAKIAKVHYRNSIDLLASDRKSELLKFGLSLTSDGKVDGPSSKDDIKDVLSWMERL